MAVREMHLVVFACCDYDVSFPLPGLIALELMAFAADMSVRLWYIGEGESNT